ncbi:MAG: hypothetical protein Q9227_003302 [Pyrenula ochraceoflavens]
MGSHDEDASHFRKLQSFDADYCQAHFTQYESMKTGMRLVVVDQKGPKVYGQFVLATEIHDDSGAPHTLEHLVFMGSRSYHYKGLLDKLATRMYADGTNAWTATDHTAYTVETAGWEGFAQILPVYLEHIVLPTLTDAGCLTEVHHIDGTGQDAGVVYSEMQGRENDAGELMSLRSKRLLYPEGSGFRSETGGLLERLRVLSANRIREFHKVMYQPKNLCLVVTGEIDHKNLLQILDSFENSIIGDIPSPEIPFQRPWIDSTKTPMLHRSALEQVQFPEEDEEYGQITISFLGPSCNDTLNSIAMSVVLEYLAGSSASILDNTLVEREQVASGVFYGTAPRPSTEIEFSLSSVETGKLGQVEKRFFEVLREATSRELDMSYMRDCIARQIRRTKWQTESSPNSFSEAIIYDFLFGNRDGSNLLDIRSLKIYDKLSEWKEIEWRDFIKKWLSDAPHVSILGAPSADLSEKLKTEEKARIEKQKERLGEEGLKERESALEKAKTENDRPIPSELLGQFKVPSVDSIRFVDTTAAKAGSASRHKQNPDNIIQKIVDADDNVPLFLHFENIASNFIRIRFIIATKHIPLEIRPLLAIYLESFFTLPINRDGTRVEFEQVVTELERDTASYNIGDGGKVGVAEELRITLQVESDNYEIAVKWFRDLLWHSIFDVERLVAVTNRLLADIPDAKRSGDEMLSAVQAMNHLAPESVLRAQCTLVKALYLKHIRYRLKTEPETIVKQMETLRSCLCKPENFRILVVADIEKLPKPVSTWKLLTSNLDTSKPLTPLTKRLDRLSDAAKHPGKLAFIVPMPTVDSSYAYCVTRGPTSYNEPVLPALMVAIAYLSALEGPLWVAVRGTGLAYGTKIGHNIGTGMLSLEVYRSPDAYKAFEASKTVIQKHASGEREFDPLMLEGAISTIVLAFVEDQQTPDEAAQSDFVRDVVRGLPSDYNTAMLRKVREVTVEEIRKVLNELVCNLFSPDIADVFVTCAPGLAEAIKGGFESQGFKPEVRDLNSFQDDYGLKAAEGGADAADEQEEDDELEHDHEDDDGDESDGDE